MAMRAKMTLLISAYTIVPRNIKQNSLVFTNEYPCKNGLLRTQKEYWHIGWVPSSKKQDKAGAIIYRILPDTPILQFIKSTANAQQQLTAIIDHDQFATSATSTPAAA
jgi:hypothetical protein